MLVFSETKINKNIGLVKKKEKKSHILKNWKPNK